MARLHNGTRKIAKQFKALCEKFRKEHKLSKVSMTGILDILGYVYLKEWESLIQFKDSKKKVD